MWTRDPDPGPSLWTRHELLVTGPSLSGLPASTITSESDPHKRQLVAGTLRASVQSYLTVGLGLPSPARCTPPTARCVSVHWKDVSAGDVSAGEVTALHPPGPGVPPSLRARFPSAGPRHGPVHTAALRDFLNLPTEHPAGHSSEHGYTHNSLGTNRKAMNCSVPACLWAKQPRRPESPQGITTK